MKKVTVIEGPRLVFDTLESAAEVLGKSVSAISRAIRDGDPKVRMVDRVFVGRLKDGTWTGPIVMNSRNSGYIQVDGSLNVIRKCDVVERKDITACWYFGTKIVGDFK